MRLRFARRIRVVAGALLALGVGAAGACIAASQPSTSDVSALTQRLDDLARERQRVQQQLRAVKQRQRRVTRQLADLDYQVTRADRRLDTAEQQAAETRTALVEVTADCEAAEAQFADHEGHVGERLAAAYKMGEARPIEVLLGARSFADLANRMYLLNQVVGRDAELLAEYDTARTTARQQREELARRAEELSRLQTRLTQERRRASAEKVRVAERKRTLLADRAAWERALAELEQDSREVEEMLRRMQQTPEGQERLAQAWRGKLQWPTRGRISSGYGYRVHPIYRVRKMHTGIDIAVPTGTPIRAAAGGTVVHASRWGGYGNCVIVDHGGGYATLYGHCSRIAVAESQLVKVGQVIAYAGSTGLATGPHLHFELRRDGRPTNPMSLLP
jgi:murein DD-endopeptidase MepM/ murein hydrolase activator NlpD